MLQHNWSQFVDPWVFEDAFALVPCAVDEHGFLNWQIVKRVLPQARWHWSIISLDLVPLVFEQGTVAVDVR